MTEASGTTELAHPSCIPLEGNWIQLGESEANDNHVLVGEYACLFCGKGDLIVAGPQPGEAYARRKAAKAALGRQLERRAEQARKDRQAARGWRETDR